MHERWRSRCEEADRHDIIDGSLTGKEFKQGSIGESRLSQEVQRKLNTTVSGSSAATPGVKGDTGAAGAEGREGRPRRAGWIQTILAWCRR